MQAVEEPFIGWAGETYKPAETVGAAAQQLGQLEALQYSSAVLLC